MVKLLGLYRRDSVQETITAVHYAEIENFFSMLGLLEQIKQGELRCYICGSVITFSNFRAINKKSGILLFSCEKEDCFSKFTSVSTEKQE